MFELAESVLRWASNKGATYSDLIWSNHQLRRVECDLRATRLIEHSNLGMLTVRVFDGLRVAQLCSRDLRPATLESLVDRALREARASEPTAQAPPAKSLPVSAENLELFDSHPLPTLDQQVERTHELSAAAGTGDISEVLARYNLGHAETMYLDSRGHRTRYRSSYHQLSASVIAIRGDERQRWTERTTRRHASDLPAIETLGMLASTKALRRLGARSISSAEMPVVLGPRAAGRILRRIALALDGRRLVRSATFLKPGQLGSNIAAPGVSITDNPKLRRGLGSRPFDADGRPTSPTSIIRDGRLENFLLDCHTALRLGLPDSGNGWHTRGGQPTIAPSNFQMRGGSASAESLIDSVHRGLYLESLMAPGYDPFSGECSSAASGYWIENGEITFPVDRVAIAGNLTQIMMNISGVGSDTDPIGRTVDAPTLLVTRLSIAGF